MTTPTSVDGYIASLPEGRRAAVQALRQAIRGAAPAAVETIAYRMPAFKMDGRFLVSYAAFKNHYSLFPASAVVVEAVGDELTPYLAGKGTIRFPASAPIPASLVTEVVKVRVAEVTARDGPGSGRDRL
jgi:uncharacterized protein YdhG (YjbR/CyaY superfamily)